MVCWLRVSSYRCQPYRPISVLLACTLHLERGLFQDDQRLHNVHAVCVYPMPETIEMHEPALLLAGSRENGTVLSPYPLGGRL